MVVAPIEKIMQPKKMTRSAFTMIELVFAIVIISISILALPTVLLNDATSQEQTLKEEGIMLTATKISQILTYPWDESSSPLGALMSTSQVLNTANGDTELGRNGITDFRFGHFADELRRRMTPFSAQRAAGPIGGAVGTNIGAFNGDVETVGGSADGNMTLGYKKEYQTTTTVGYINDETGYAATDIVFNFSDIPGANITNIKMIQVTTHEKSPDPAVGWVPIIQMTSYSANIGEEEYAKRRY